MCNSRMEEKTNEKSKNRKVARWLKRIKDPLAGMEAGNHRIGKVSPTKHMLHLPEQVWSPIKSGLNTLPLQ